MIVECPQCKAKYRLDEKQFVGRREVRVRCTRCNNAFPIQASTTATMAPTAAPPSMPEATVVSQTDSSLTLPHGKRLSLSVTNGKDKGKVHQVTKPRMVVGRTDTDIVVDDTEVSRQHCALEVHGVKVRVVDLGSTNGTFVGGQRVESSEIDHLGEFRIGGTTLMLTVFDSF